MAKALKPHGTDAASAEADMSVWEHLEDLRWAVTRSVIGIVVGIIICWIFADWIIETVVMAPAKHTTPPLRLSNTEIFGAVGVYMQVVLWGGVILSFPYTILQIWKFVVPGLKERERTYVRSISFFTAFSFIAGMVFAYFIMLPMTLDFVSDAGTFGMKDVVNIPNVSSYLTILLEVLIISGLVFELPLISYFLSKIGILTPKFMRKYRKHTIVLLLLIAAVLSPGGNPILQLVLFVPLWALFELSIASSALVAWQKRREAKTAPSGG